MTVPVEALPPLRVSKADDLPLRLQSRAELVNAPGDFVVITHPAPALPPTPDTPTHLLVLCDHHGVVHRIPCHMGNPKPGLWALTGTTKRPSLRPSVRLTAYVGYVAYSGLTPDLSPE